MSTFGDPWADAFFYSVAMVCVTFLVLRLRKSPFEQLKRKLQEDPSDSTGALGSGFPANPEIGDLYNYLGVDYRWDGKVWIKWSIKDYG